MANSVVCWSACLSCFCCCSCCFHKGTQSEKHDAHLLEGVIDRSRESTSMNNQMSTTKQAGRLFTGPVKLIADSQIIVKTINKLFNYYTKELGF